ncbi:hypothetical protein RIF29_37217 [Crotalaria pallida]|uniref:Replication factor C subunit 3 n=1 Tax=Crotalaria pallida TaxID=3830 RepID=A0AAN9HSP0_CROPI
MEKSLDSPPDNRFQHTPNSRFSTKKGRSGYEPSDTETEWQEFPRHERERLRNKSPIALHRMQTSWFENEVTSSVPRRRNHSKSPYKPRITEDIDNAALSSPVIGLNTKRHISPLERNVSPYNNRKHEQRTTSRQNRQGGSVLLEVDRVSDKSNLKRAATAPRLRPQQNNMRKREVSPFKAPSVGEINEMMAEAKLSQNPTADHYSVVESSDSIQIQPGDIFFSRETNALHGKNSSLTKPLQVQQLGYVSPSPMVNTIRSSTPYNGNHNMNIRGASSSSNVLSRTNSAATSRKGSINGKLSTTVSNSMTSEVSGKTTESMRKFAANRKKNHQNGSWFACMRTAGNCSTSRKSPERRPIDESSFIQRAVVVESLPQFWADKHQPASLDGFICNRQEALLLKELVSQGSFPHLLLKGPSGSSKRELAIALLREIYGDACCNDKRPMKVSVPVTSSSHHMELNVNLEPYAKYALLGLIKEISNIYAVTPEVSDVNFKSDLKVIILYEVDKAVENIQHMIKWIIDRYSDICKLIICCEDDAGILEPVKNRFKVINVDAPQSHEITKVLMLIAQMEEIDLPMNLAAKIAAKSKQNLRKAIMAFEACRAHNLLSIRGKFQMLLLDFVHPKLILQKLVEQLLKRTEVSLKREVYYWHAYYDRRLPPGTTALLKLEEFVAKFMSIYRKASSSQQYYCSTFANNIKGKCTTRGTTKIPEWKNISAFQIKCDIARAYGLKLHSENKNKQMSIRT